MGPLACCGCLRLGVLPWPLGCFPGLWAGLGPGGAAIGLPFFCCFAGPSSKGPSCETVPSPTPSAQAPFERTARGLCSCGCAWGGRRIRARAWVVNSPRVALCLSVSCPFAARGAPVPGCPPPLPSVLPSPCWAPWCVRVSCLFVRHAPLPACAFGCVCFPFAYPGCCLVWSGGLFCSLGDWAGAGGREDWGRCGCRRCARRLQVGRRDTEAARCALGRQGGRGCLVLLLLLFLPLFFCFCLWVLPCCFLCLVSCLLLVSAFALCLLVSAFWCVVLSLAPPSGRGFSFSLSIAAVLRSSRVEYKSLGPGPPKAECSSGVWGRAPGLLNGLVFCAVGGLGGLAAYFAACRPSYGV